MRLSFLTGLFTGGGYIILTHFYVVKLDTLKPEPLIAMWLFLSLMSFVLDWKKKEEKKK